MKSARLSIPGLVLVTAVALGGCGSSREVNFFATDAYPQRLSEWEATLSASTWEK